VADVLGTFGVYRRLAGARIRADFQYRVSFAIFLVGQTLAGIGELVAIVVLFGQLDALGGWSGVEVAFLYGLSGLAFSIGDVFVSQVETISGHIKAGTFDRFLLRPMGTLVQLSAMEFALRRVGRAIVPVAVLATVVPRLEVAWGVAEVVLGMLALAAGVGIFSSIWVLTSSIAFWTVETHEMGGAFVYGGNVLTSYPIDLFGTALRRIVVFVLPLAFVAYLPAATLLGKPQPFGLPAATGYAAPVVAAVLAVTAGSVWRRALRHYRSTGS